MEKTNGMCKTSCHHQNDFVQWDCLDRGLARFGCQGPGNFWGFGDFCCSYCSLHHEGVKYLCIPAADSPSQNLLAGVSRSVTLVIAYIMTVTDFGWEDALHTVRAGRSCANPNVGFQRQLQEFEKHEVHQYRQWLKEEYGESPLQDAEEAKNILGSCCTPRASKDSCGGPSSSLRAADTKSVYPSQKERSLGAACAPRCY
nr:dual specificity protein phosphatase 22 isoform X5 [Pan paniscus]